jgi:hypothetical protein
MPKQISVYDRMEIDTRFPSYKGSLVEAYVVKDDLGNERYIPRFWMIRVSMQDIAPSNSINRLRRELDEAEQHIERHQIPDMPS